MFNLGETIVCTVLLTVNGTPTDPTSTPQVAVTDNYGAVVVNRSNMTREDTGSYYYDWSTDDEDISTGYFQVYIYYSYGTRDFIVRSEVRIV